MSTPAVFGIYGKSDTGKTTLMVRLVDHFAKEGYRIATVKQTNKSISLDTTEKDTWRHQDAGANLVVFSSASETDFLMKSAMSISEIIQKMSEFGCYDLILVEGANDPDIPKVMIGAGKKRENTVALYKNNFHELLLIIKKELKMKQSLQHIFVSVNGKNVSLTKFPEQIFTNIIVGMVHSLKGVSDINEVTIHLKR
jgi:molybdopterin-guanine dinucleotide biosynthesis protein MobB